MRTLTLLCAALAPLAAGAQLRDENLLFSPPSGFHVGFENGGPQGSILEMVPDGQTVEHWNEMLTVQIFRGEATGRIPAFRAKMQMLLAAACAGATSAPVADGRQRERVCVRGVDPGLSAQPVERHAGARVPEGDRRPRQPLRRAARLALRG